MAQTTTNDINNTTPTQQTSNKTKQSELETAAAAKAAAVHEEEGATVSAGAATSATAAIGDDGKAAAGNGDAAGKKGDADGGAKDDEYEIRDYAEFDDMELKRDLLFGVYACGYEKPSVIQQLAVVPLARGYDTVGQAQSGTGKTAAFSLGVLQQVDTGSNDTQALILVPTRELAMQAHDTITALGARLDVRSLACVGGTNVRQMTDALRRGVHVACGTPGRVRDMIRRRALVTDTIRLLVLDEADVMLANGFIDDIYAVLQELPRSCQIGIFSATMPAEALDICKRFMRPNAVRILVPEEKVSLSGIGQYYVDVEYDDQKADVLCDLYERMNISQAIVFCRSRIGVERLARIMDERDFTVGVTHSDLSTEERMRVLNGFKLGLCRVLLSTDLYARGIDAQSTALVINMDLPREQETYIHRIGRSGRFGRKGFAISIVNPRELKGLLELQRIYGQPIDPLTDAVIDEAGRG